MTELNGDELAGIVDLFEGMTRSELQRAWEELAFRETGTTPTEGSVTSAIEEALERYHLVEQDLEDSRVLLVGPAAFPRVPDGGDDLPHLVDVPDRPIDRQAVANRLLEGALAEATDDLAPDRRRELRELAYDLESWSAIDAGQLLDAITDAEAGRDN